MRWDQSKQAGDVIKVFFFFLNSDYVCINLTVLVCLFSDYKYDVPCQDAEEGVFP